MKYYLKTEVGIFLISNAPYGGYNLIIDDDVVNWANSAEELATQVHEKTSGFEDWDKNTEESSPETIEKWQVKI